MSLTRRRLFTGMIETPRQGEWISARGREAAMAGHADAQTGTPVSRAIRISSNENPLGPGQHVVDAVVGKFPEAARYPFNATQKEGALITALAQKFSAKTDNIVLGPGSGELLTHAVRAFTSPTKPLVTAWPSFENPRDVAKKIGTPVREVGFDGEAADRHRQDGRGLEGRRPGVLLQSRTTRPPTVHGKTAVADMVKAIRAASPDAVILIDEAYHDYVTDPAYQSAIDVALATPNVFVTRTFSKAYGMAGLRAGYAIGHAPTIKAVTAYKTPYALGTLTLGGAIVALANQPHIDAERKRNTEAPGVHGEGVRRPGHHRHRLADQLRVHGNQAPGRRLPRRLPRRRRLRRPRLPAVPEQLRPRLDRHDGRDAARRRRVQDRPGRCDQHLPAGGALTVSRVKEVSAMSLSRRSFVHTMGAGAAGLWIGARGPRGLALRRSRCWRRGRRRR